MKGAGLGRTIAAALVAVAGGLAACGAEPAARRPNVVLLTIESLRPDHLASFGGPRTTTPELDALADEAVFYTDAHAVTSWTLTSHASLFTGLYPTAHQTTGPRSKLGPRYATLAGTLAEKGYACAGFASGPYMRREHGLDRGFELYDDSPAETTSSAGHADVTNEAMQRLVSDWLLARRDDGRPFFLFAYYWDPHYDYIPPPPFDTRFVDGQCRVIDVTGYETAGRITADISPAELRYVEAQYDGEIACTDTYVGRLFDLLRSEGHWEDTLVIVTSDHGEEFFDHGEKGHKHNLYVESVHVPLVVKYPRSASIGRDARTVSLVDVFPTVLEVVDVAPPGPLHGRSLLAPPPEEERPVFFELLSRWYFPEPEGGTRAEDEEWLAVKRGDYKLVAVPSRGRVELYDVAADPGETTDVAARHPGRARRLSELLSSWRRDMKAVARLHGEGGEADLSPDDLERLRALGYVR